MLKRSDVVQIPIPFSDLTQQKRRPVMLLTSPEAFERIYGEICVMLGCKSCK